MPLKSNNFAMLSFNPPFSVLHLSRGGLFLKLNILLLEVGKSMHNVVYR